jgi:hypothetical protein
VPRYFFNVLDGRSKTLVRDSEGAVFSGIEDATKEAVGLGRDVAHHGLYGPNPTWKLVVTDENGREVLTVPLVETRLRRIRTWFDAVRHVAIVETSARPHIFAWLLAAAMLGIIVQTAIKTTSLTENSRGYESASVPTNGVLVAVRFVPAARADDIERFLEAYNASIVGGPQAGGLFRLHVGNTNLPEGELAAIVKRMTREAVVEFAVAVQ